MNSHSTGTVTVHVITPIVSEDFRDLERDLKPFERAGLQITHSYIQKGPSTVSGRIQEWYAGKEVLGEGREAKDSGVDAIVLDCMADPGVALLRTALRMTVLGPFQTALNIAKTIGTRIGIIFPSAGAFEMAREMVRRYDIPSHSVFMGSTDQDILGLAADRDQTIERMVDVSNQLILREQVNVIVSGCTGYLGFMPEVQRRLDNQVAVIDPLPLTILTAETFVRLGISHSEACYPTPEESSEVWQLMQE